MLTTWLRAVARLAAGPPLAVVGAMRAVLERLPADRREVMAATQVDATATLLTPQERRGINGSDRRRRGERSSAGEVAARGAGRQIFSPEAAFDVTRAVPVADRP